MDCKSQLITKNELIKLCALSQTADDARVNVCIQQAQNSLRAVLCRDFFNELITEFEAESYTGLNETLVEVYIRPYLSWLAYEKYVLIGSQANTKAGFREHLDDDSQPVTDQRLKSLMKNAYEQSEYHKRDMINYLYENENQFTTWKNSGCYCMEQDITFKITGAGTKKQSDECTTVRQQRSDCGYCS